MLVGSLVFDDGLLLDAVDDGPCREEGCNDDDDTDGDEGSDVGATVRVDDDGGPSVGGDVVVVVVDVGSKVVVGAGVGGSNAFQPGSLLVSLNSSTIDPSAREFIYLNVPFHGVSS
jgi:hypothetical protein